MQDPIWSINSGSMTRDPFFRQSRMKTFSRLQETQNPYFHFLRGDW